MEVLRLYAVQGAFRPGRSRYSDHSAEEGLAMKDGLYSITKTSASARGVI